MSEKTTIEFVPNKITIKTLQDEQVVDREEEGVVAEGVGLAYVVRQNCEGEPMITLTHMVSGARIGGDWQVSTEQEARAWIEALNEIIDWTGDRPRVREAMKGKVVYLAIIGTLHELEGEEEGEQAE